MVGDQLFISYNQQYLPVQLRRDKLHETYGFWCDCQECFAPDKCRGLPAHIAQPESFIHND